jgi:AmmeMemoRadiSam system protein B/AmmeMemoRadiSam system protein A
LFIPILACAQKKEAIVVREPAWANQFYPGNKDTLSRDIDEMLDQATPAPVSGTILAIAVPHAGYPFSGPTAAFAYKAIAGSDIRTVVMVGPSHYVAFHGVAVYAKGAWKTALGTVPIDETLAAEIIKQNPVIQNMPQVHGHEHSLEVELPFLQKTLKDFKIVPIMVWDTEYDELEILGDALAKTCGNRKVLLLASSDLYHGYSVAECRQSDSVTLSDMGKFDPDGFHAAITDGSAAACGGAPIAAVMLAARKLGADTAQVLARTNSHDVAGTPDGQWTVGYGATVFVKRSPGSSSPGPSSTGDKVTKDEQTKDDSTSLNQDEQAELLRIARTTVESYVRDGKTPDFAPLTERLQEERGVFVTLREHGDLRGCIGYIQGIKPVYEAVRDNAIAAATEDPRFPPVQTKELKDIDIEITVLTPLELCHDPLKDVVAGQYGVVIRRGGRSGVFLPQVATETGWDTRTFLSECCTEKAGLPADAWQDQGTEVYRFRGQVFAEKE